MSFISVSRRFLFLLFVLLFANGNCLFAGGSGTTTGARSAGMGRCSVALQGLWSIQNNQAGFALTDKITAGIGYDSRFMSGAMSTKSLAVLVPVKYGVTGISIDYYGYSLYNELKAGLAYAKAFGEHLRIGLQIDYLRTSLGDNYGNKEGVTFEIGLQADMNRNLTLGVWTYNPVMIKLADYAGERIPSVYRLGMAYRFSPVLLTTLEVEKRSDRQPVVLHGGMEYVIRQRFFMRAGFGTSREIFSMGFGIKLSKLQLDLAAVMHESLGFSPVMSLSFHF